MVYQVGVCLAGNFVLLLCTVLQRLRLILPLTKEEELAELSPRICNRIFNPTAACCSRRSKVPKWTAERGNDEIRGENQRG
jgi:hypothetical protein